MLRLDAECEAGRFTIGQWMQAPHIDEIEDVYEELLMELSARMLNPSTIEE